ncbi:hypothetical protein, partial [Aeromonas caviae]|uniref:hypothetical protein n=1 Tax=Aeromonas caviae TaxID=648 RepID=UPI001CC74A97
MQHCSELTPRSPVPWASAPATAAALRPTHQVMATARPRIKVTLQQPLGDMTIIQQCASGSDLAPPGQPQACRHPPDRCRHRLVVGAL